ncbi:ribonuclease HI [Desulfolucanica intricata]|uniref:ribonuclease HI n=1 Tax=Desulfolucanica intricata TaxID=1285191 RepID=UPI00082EE706|nr:ribonuclease HI [Desulfolucanica intricata]
MNEVEIYTDGACSGNPGPGGYGVVLKYKENIKELSAAYKETTNNRMEILAAIIGLEALKRPCKVILYSDSQYLVNAMTKDWVKRWKANNWMRNKNEPAKNVDLWKRLIPLTEKHQITWRWVKGHADNYYNNRCDHLAVTAIKEQKPLIDEGFRE